LIEKYTIEIEGKVLGKSELGREINKKGVEMLAGY
jgi:hypothetical protein